MFDKYLILSITRSRKVIYTPNTNTKLCHSRECITKQGRLIQKNQNGEWLRWMSRKLGGRFHDMVNLFPNIPVHCLCNKHLNSVLAEFNNLLLPSMRKGNSIKGYLDHGCVDLSITNERICECVEEYKRRGLDWKYTDPNESDVALIDSYLERYGDITPEHRAEMTEMNIRVLAFRCPECRTRLRKYKYFGVV